MPLRLFAPRYWPTWAALGILRALSLLPFSWLVMLGRTLGAILRRLPVASFGLTLLETGFAWWSSAARVQKIVHVEGIENLQAALERGRGVILLTAHFIPLELGGRILASIAPINILYRQPKNEVLAHFLAQCRCAHGHPIPRDDIRSQITALKKNECVWYAPDRSYGEKGAQRLRLFDIPAATQTLTSRLARMTGATVLLYLFERLPGSRGYRAVLQPPSGTFPGDAPGNDISTGTLHAASTFHLKHEWRCSKSSRNGPPPDYRCAVNPLTDSVYRSSTPARQNTCSRAAAPARPGTLAYRLQSQYFTLQS